MAKFKTICAAAAALMMVGGWANAATCTGADRDISLDVAIGGCVASSATSPEDNIGNGTEGSWADGYVEIDDSGDAPTTYLSGDITDGLSGEITVTGDLSAYDSILIGLKFGNPHLDIIWAVFEIAGEGTYEWSTTGTNNLSHVVLYGRMGEVPLPAAGFLLLAGLGGLALMRRKSA